MIWKICCLDMLKEPLLLLKEKEVEDEVRKLNKEPTVQVSPATAGTMMTKVQMQVKNNTNPH